jgi:hypothetical protein
MTSFINESGSSLRGFITEWMTSDEEQDEDCLETGGSLEKTFFLPDLSPPHIELCSLDSQPNTPYLDLSFLIHWSYAASCNNMNSVDEGIELSVRRKGDQLWTPLAFFARNEGRLNDDYGIDLDYSAGRDTVHIRGFSVPVTINDTDVQHNMTFRICSEAVLGSRGVQFRWLQTAQHFNDGFRDTWSLDDVSVSVTHDSSCSEVVFFDDFENEGDTPSSVQWTASRRARIKEDSGICNDGRNGSAAWFGDYPLVSPETRMIATRLIRLERDVVCPLMSLDEELMAIFLLLYSDVEVGMSQLEDYLDAEAAETVNETQVVYLTTVILDIFGEAPVSRNLSQSFVNIAGQLISAVSSRPEPQEEPPSSSDGSQLLENLDQFALNNHQPSSGNITSDTLSLTVRSGEGEEGDVGVIDNGPFSLSLPSQVFNGPNSETTVYASSFLFANVSGLLDNSLPSNQDNDYALLGPVLSSFVHSNGRLLERRSLKSPVKITFPFSTGDAPICVFWNFTLTAWDTRGCESELNGETITCFCNHLTHFAVLLSPGDATSDEGVRLSLQVIGIVGVTVSVIFLLITIFTFIAFRSLWSLRNYIHIQLCVCLVIAQLVFVIGVEPRGNEDACSAVAILLHYFWLVCFMWMLMEGAVLYVALVKVFDTQHLKYVVAFTVISYGGPLVYMLVCIPLGLALTGSDGNDHYGYSEACWLRYDTGFIWAFTAPVLLIITVSLSPHMNLTVANVLLFLLHQINVFFFIMAMVVICRHRRSLAHLSRRRQTINWMKASISLVIVMGITWIMGVLVFTDDLLPVAYIFTIFVAFQGLIIFIVLVIFSKQVRQTYTKWWKVSVVNSEFLSKYFSDWSWTTKTSMHSNGTVSPTMNKEGTVSVVIGAMGQLSHRGDTFLLHSSKASVSSPPPSSIHPLAEESSFIDPQPENGTAPGN